MKSQHLLRQDAARIWNAALRAVDPEIALRRIVKREGSVLRIRTTSLDLKKMRNLWVLGAGKAAAPMGRAIEKILGRHISGGVLVTKYGHGFPLKSLDMVEAGHPLPDANSLAAGERILAFAESKIQPNDLVLCPLSGGASSLLVLPAEGITLQDKIACTRLLLESGADIHELNAVRKHLSTIKGGGLARMLTPARTVGLILSDVVGDDPGTIASGPLSPDGTTFGDCLEIFRKLGVQDQVPAAVIKRFELGFAGQIAETPKMLDPVFRGIESFIIGSNAQACTAAAQAARRLGYHAQVLTSRLEGDTGEAARFHMSVAGEIVSQRRPVRRPACIISGGETTVKVTGKGKGGRNQEFVLRCVRPLAGLPAPCLVASLGTDGTDGPTDAAGAVADNSTLTRSLKYGSRFLEETLGNNDSYTFFHRLGDIIVTGPTRTNVMDLHIMLIG
ncbi:MAG TPA: glycerate kinase [Acidobacteriota bacterium]|nr:glycerate kinase [Acidobacteriota bacterium]